MTVTVHVTPAPTYDYRARAGIVWPRGKHTVAVVDAPARPTYDDKGQFSGPVQIDAKALDALRADSPYFVVETSGGAPSESVDALKATIANLEKQVEQLTAHLESLTKPAKGK